MCDFVKGEAIVDLLNNALYLAKELDIKVNFLRNTNTPIQFFYDRGSKEILIFDPTTPCDTCVRRWVEQCSASRDLNSPCERYLKEEVK